MTLYMVKTRGTFRGKQTMFLPEYGSYSLIERATPKGAVRAARKAYAEYAPLDIDVYEWKSAQVWTVCTTTSGKPYGIDGSLWAYGPDLEQ